MKKLFALLLVSMLLTGCYWNDDVGTDQAGVVVDAGRIVDCLEPGVYSNGSWYADLKEISLATLTFEVADNEVATFDNQLVGVTITVQARRNSNCDALKNLLTNWPTLTNDDQLKAVIDATTNEGIKIGVRQFILEGLLNDRNGLADSILAALEEDAKEYSVTIINVTVKGITLSPEYAAQLQKNAQYTAEIEGLKKEQAKNQIAAETAALQQENQAKIYLAQLETEKAKTEVDVEIAEREGKKTAAAQQVYADNPQAYEIEKLKRLAEIFGDKATVYFIPEGTDLTMLFNPGAVVPLTEEPQQ